MVTRAIVLFALVISIPLAGWAEQGAVKMNKASKRAAQIQPGTYKGPGGKTIQVKKATSPGGKASDLAAKGIIVIDAKPADGIYKAADGTSIVVKRGIIIDNKSLSGAIAPVDSRSGVIAPSDVLGPTDSRSGVIAPSDVLGPTDSRSGVIAPSDAIISPCD